MILCHFEGFLTQDYYTSSQPDLNFFKLDDNQDVQLTEVEGFTITKITSEKIIGWVHDERQLQEVLQAHETTSLTHLLNGKLSILVSTNVLRKHIRDIQKVLVANY